MLDFFSSWLPSIHESPEVRETSARLKIVLGRSVLTRNVDEWTRTVQDDVRLSAYPMAVWFVSNWWRLLCEPMPASLDATPLSWRMAHELAAAGHGYVWPNVLIASDGETVQLWATPSDAGEPSPVNFLSAAHDSLSARLRVRRHNERSQRSSCVPYRHWRRSCRVTGPRKRSKTQPATSASGLLRCNLNSSTTHC